MIMNKDEVVEQAKQAVTMLVRLMVNSPDAVRVEAVEANPGLTVLSIYTAKGEEGTAIGKQGRLAEAMRDILEAISAHHKYWLQYEVVSEWNPRPERGVQ
jgi:predicted RNA-binding protein YlqC (UPF0109 family)